MKLLVTSAVGAEEGLLDEIRALGHETLWVEDEGAALPAAGYAADGVVCNALFVHHDVSLFPHLRLVQLTSAGQDRVPVAELDGRGIALFNAAGVYSVPLAEWVVLQVLQLVKHSRGFLRHQESKQWRKDRGLRELGGRTVCIVGFGAVGREVAVRLRPFGMRIVAVRRETQETPGVDDVVALSSLRDAVAAADVVVLTLPLTPKTRHIVDGAVIAAMRADAILINVSRGQLVDEGALIQALGSGHLLGVALDVFEHEPLSRDSPLWEIERVLVTPHNAFVSDRVSSRLHDTVVRNLRAFSEAELP